MAMYGGPTPKRHCAYSNSPGIAKLYLGKLEGWAKKVQAEDQAGVERIKTVTKYVDSQGKVRYKGAEGLKPSESEPQLLQNKIHSMSNLELVFLVSSRFFYLSQLSPEELS
jgi:hypothetical protein